MPRLCAEVIWERQIYRKLNRIVITICGHSGYCFLLAKYKDLLVVRLKTIKYYEGFFCYLSFLPLLPVFLFFWFHLSSVYLDELIEIIERKYSPLKSSSLLTIYINQILSWSISSLKLGRSAIGLIQPPQNF